MSSAFVISLDLELFWGLHDLPEVGRHAANLDGVRAATDGICSLFERYGIHATWATVGLLMARDRDDALANAPDLRPTYTDPRLSPYRWLESLPANEERFFGPDLVDRVLATPGQEIGSHTYSHYTCLEPGQTFAQFRADLRAARAMIERTGREARSLVFPRNQYAPEHLAIAAEEGFSFVRGQPHVPMYRPRPGAAQHAGWRALRLVDAHLPVVGSDQLTFVPESEHGIVNVPASRLLRPSGGGPLLGELRLRRILAELRAATERGRSYHLWWHPHGFGTHLEANLEALETILIHASYLRDRFGLESRAMAELGEEVRRAA